MLSAAFFIKDNIILAIMTFTSMRILNKFLFQAEWDPQAEQETGLMFVVDDIQMRAGIIWSPLLMKVKMQSSHG